MTSIDSDLRAAVDERLAARLEDTRRRRAEREQARAEKNARRTAGIRKRHARILARRGRDQDPEVQSPTEHTESLRASPGGRTYERAVNRSTVGTSTVGRTEDDSQEVTTDGS